VFAVDVPRVTGALTLTLTLTLTDSLVDISALTHTHVRVHSRSLTSTHAIAFTHGYSLTHSFACSRTLTHSHALSTLHQKVSILCGNLASHEEVARDQFRRIGLHFQRGSILLYPTHACNHELEHKHTTLHSSDTHLTDFVFQKLVVLYESV
jgi:hypothetical protein